MKIFIKKYTLIGNSCISLCTFVLLCAIMQIVFGCSKNEEEHGFRMQINEANDLIQQKKWDDASGLLQSISDALKNSSKSNHPTLQEVEKMASKVRNLKEEQRATTYHALSRYLLEDAEAKIREMHFDQAKKLLHEYLGRLLVDNSERAQHLLSGLENLDSSKKSFDYLVNASDIDYKVFCYGVVPDSFFRFDIPQLQDAFLNGLRSCLADPANESKIANARAKNNINIASHPKDRYNQNVRQQLDMPFDKPTPREAANEVLDRVTSTHEGRALVNKIGSREQALTSFQRMEGISESIAEEAIKQWVIQHNSLDWDLEEVKRTCLRIKYR